MKSKIICLFFVLVFVKVYSQKTDTIVVYDHVIVYDTIKVYDTLFVYDTVSIPDEIFFQKNNALKGAVLTRDSSQMGLDLKLFFQNDTATILNNSILLSENVKNPEAMKKQILTLVMSAMLAQTGIAQEKPNGSQTENPTPKVTINVGVLAAGNTQRGGNFYGLYFNVNRVIRPKFTLGLSSDIGGIYQKGYSNPYNLLVRSSTGDIKGFHNNIFITTSYYFIGNSDFASKGAYFKLGIGSLQYQTHQTESNYIYGTRYDASYIVTSFNISAQLCLGFEAKLEKRGKLFVEAMSMPSLNESYFIATKKFTGPGEWPNTKHKSSDITKNSYAQQFGLRIGYKMSF